MTIRSYANPIFDPGGIAAQKRVFDVDVIQTECMHDVAIITLRGENMNAPELRPGTPVRMDYGWYTAQMETFYGYVDHIESSYGRITPEQLHFDDVVCLGVSYALKDPFVGSWSSVQASTLVQQVVSQYYLASLVEIDDTIWPQLSSPSVSAWQFLVSLANKLGYVLACNKSLLRFVSVEQSMAQNQATMPVFYTRHSAPTYAFQTVTRFNAVQGETFQIPGHVRATRLAGGIDQRTGQLITVSDNASSVDQTAIARQVPYPFFSQAQTDLVITDQSQGLAALSGLAQQNRFHYQAEATLSGDTSVVQGMPVVLTGISAKDDGVWWVQEVKHKIIWPGYSMDVMLGRDSSGDDGNRPTSTPMIGFLASNPYAIALSKVPDTVLVNRRWRAAFQSNIQITGSSR